MNKKRLIPVAAIVVVGAAIVYFATRGGGKGPLTASGTVEATEARLGFDVSGRVDTVTVHEGDTVDRGRVLAVLDTTQAQARAAQARAQLAAAEALLTELRRGSRSEEIAQAQAQVQAASDRLEQARRDLARTKELFDGGAVSPEQYDNAGTALQVAQSQADQAAEQLKLVRSGPRAERIQAQAAAVEQARATLNGQLAALDLMTISAPFDGIVTVRHREPGETVGAGAPVVTLMNPGDRWVRIYVPENRVGRVSLGEAAIITADSFPGKSYRGKVTYIASQAEFTPKNVQTSEERVKLVYSIKVEITGDSAMELKPGMPADVQLTAEGS
jgi:HlyD family secretion protein